MDEPTTTKTHEKVPRRRAERPVFLSKARERREPPEDPLPHRLPVGEEEAEKARLR